MARMTKAQQIERENEQQALAFFRAALESLPDARRRQGLRYPLQTVVVTALMAMVCGCDDAEAMQAWGEAHAEWLTTMLEMPHGPPTQDVYLAVFGALDPEAFSAVFRAWAELLALRLSVGDKHIAVDGKTSRRSFDTASGKGALHTVSAWLSDVGLVLGQQKTTDKSNEITAIPELLSVLATGKTSTETAYYIGSDPEATAADTGAATRLHWSIENGLHWVLDLAFREDDARHRAKHTAQNMTTLRHFALNIIKADPDRKLGVANCRKRAGWDRDYLVKLLTGA